MSKLPLSGILFINTRPKGQNEELTTLLKSRGGEVIEFPTLEIQALQSSKNIAEIVSSLTVNDWIVFTSANGMWAVEKRAGSPFRTGSVKAQIAVIGEGTKEAVRAVGSEVQFVAENSNSEGFADEFIQFLKNTSAKVGRLVLFRGKDAADVLPKRLDAAGFTVESHCVYEATPAKLSEVDIEYLFSAVRFRMLQAQPTTASGKRIYPAMIIFTSSLATRNFLQLTCGSDLSPSKSEIAALIRKIPAAVIGPKTKETAEELGFRVVCCPKRPSVQELVEEIVRVGA